LQHVFGLCDTCLDDHDGDAGATPPLTSTMLPLSDAAAQFRRHLEAENKAPATLRAFPAGLQNLRVFPARQGMPEHVEAVRREHLEAFVLDRLRRYSQASVARKTALALDRYLRERTRR
jgi:hypothetical protein